MSVSNVETIDIEQVNISACFFEKRDLWKNKQLKRGSKPLFDFCLDFGIRFEDLIEAGIIERKETPDNTALSDYQITAKGNEYLVAEYESFWVVGSKLEALDDFIEQYIHDMLVGRIAVAS
ncbi:hypothetical protein [Vibrio penaeicida]|uniref:Uncharacterized protein n=1 Tax=Vibrio penaeicida TaxID=104609 RepID=A0AAV5NZ10_9VIBR|nr:hypothetical protein [Vibrio penaeicida]RTZ24640.1 hypothetical protein EKN09_02420 [Vibrio penaeicida]GLQ75554.1 hypothetical protein GCM10007932_49160 [Vibrio penaeicida]